MLGDQLGVGGSVFNKLKGDLSFSNRQARVNSVDPAKTAPSGAVLFASLCASYGNISLS